MIILDSNVIVARLISQDILHAEATRLLEQQRDGVAVIAPVLLEVSQVLRKNGVEKQEVARLIRSLADTAKIVSETEEMARNAAKTFEQRFGQLSFADCLLFQLAGPRVTALTFDDNLRKAIQQKEA